jgi:hypothetical protein
MISISRERRSQKFMKKRGGNGMGVGEEDC